MKCPYRIIKTVNFAAGAIGSDGPAEVQEFAECYGAECPLYVPEASIGDWKFKEGCKRANSETKNAGERNK